MRMSVAVILLAACACGGDGGQERDASSPVEALAVNGAGAEGAMPKQAALMAIPSNPKALRRLEAMGYKLKERGHLADAPAIGRSDGDWVGAPEPRRIGALVSSVKSRYGRSVTGNMR